MRILIEVLFPLCAMINENKIHISTVWEFDQTANFGGQSKFIIGN